MSVGDEDLFSHRDQLPGSDLLCFELGSAWIAGYRQEKEKIKAKSPFAAAFAVPGKSISIYNIFI